MFLFTVNYSCVCCSFLMCIILSHLHIRRALKGLSPLLSSAVPRLIQLCRSPTERNNSDSVLVACLVSAHDAPLCVCMPSGLPKPLNDSVSCMKICHSNIQIAYFGYVFFGLLLIFIHSHHIVCPIMCKTAGAPSQGSI